MFRNGNDESWIRLMRMKRLILIISLLPALVVPGLACSCLGPPPDARTPLAVAEWGIKNSHVVFEGTVEKIELKNWFSDLQPGETVSIRPGIHATFSSVRLYRGNQRDKFSVETGMGGGDCGYHFVIGKRYLVYAWANDSGKLSTGICSATTLLDSAGTALRVLRGEPPTLEDLTDLRSQEEKSSKEAGAAKHRVCGKVSFPKGVQPRSAQVFFWRATEDESPIPEQHSGVKYDGSFCQDWLEPGKYLIEAIAKDSDDDAFRYAGYYPGVSTRTQAQAVVVHENDGLVQADFTIVRQPLHSVHGYLRGFPENGGDQIMVILMPEPIDVLYEFKPVPLGPRGVFEFSRVPTGSYFALAFTGAHDPFSLTCVSTKVEVNVDSDVDGLTLQFVPKR